MAQADWNIVKRGWDAHVLGKAPFKFTDPVEAIKSLRVSQPRGTQQPAAQQHACGGSQPAGVHMPRRWAAAKSSAQNC